MAFVYRASVAYVFRYRGAFLLPPFAAYLAYQAAAVTLASAAVDLLAPRLPAPLWAKLAILPATFAANYAFMRLLTGGRTGETADA